MVFGLEVTSKVFTTIYNVELGKSDVLPNIWGRNSAKSYEGTAGRGYGKKRMSVLTDRIEVQYLPHPEMELTCHWCLKA